MASAPVQMVLDRLPGAKPIHGGWQVRCPAHEDANPSLSLSQGDDGRALLHCHAGCTAEAIVEALGLRLADLMPPTTREDRRIVATYRYCDESGAHLYDVLRYEPKTFKQRPADWQTRGTWKMDGVRRVLYRLPKLAGHDAIFVVEGEKDAEALAVLGLAATCNPGGAGKWHEDYARQLWTMGVRRVCLLPDHDDPGRAHMQDVARTCRTVNLEVRVLELPNLPAKGDVSDWIAAGGTKAALLELARACPVWTPSTTSAVSSPADTASEAMRRVTLTPANTITVRPVRWLWRDRMPIGALGLLGGREGIGKTTAAYTIAASVTRGDLPGDLYGHPRAVLIAAAEDSWEHTIVPRLLAAGADLSRVYRVDVATAAGVSTALSLPRDLDGLDVEARAVGAALLILDPLLSRLDGHLNTHVDAEVRIALEPLVHLAEAAGLCVLGLIHVSKGTSADPLTLLMGSRAFAAVARFVLFVMADPDTDGLRLLGQPKNNLGRTDLPTLAFRITGACVAETPEGPVWTGRLEWQGESAHTVTEALERLATAGPSDRTATGEAADWLGDYLASEGGTCESARVKAAGKSAGHSPDALKRACSRLGVRVESKGFPRRTYWQIPSQSAQWDGENLSTAPTAPTEEFPKKSVDHSRRTVGAVGAVGAVPGALAPTAPTGEVLAFDPRPFLDDHGQPAARRPS